MEQPIVTLLLVAATVFISYKGFKDQRLLERYCFDVDKVLIRKEYVRIISSGFLHNGWLHLVFNMIVLLGFGTMLEPMIGGIKVLLIYFLSMIGSELLALLVHKSHSDYTSVGASGAVNGIVYATIALFPNMPFGFLFLPLSLPAWVFGLGYILFTIYGIKARWGNAAHTSHLGGAIVGLLTAVALYPQTAASNYLPVLLIALPTIAFIVFVLYKPESLLINSFSKKQRHYSIDQEYNYRKAQERADIDSILEKIHRKGLKSLTEREKEALEEYSKANK